MIIFFLSHQKVVVLHCTSIISQEKMIRHTVGELVVSILLHLVIRKMRISQLLDWPTMFQATHAHVSNRLMNFIIIQIFQGPPTCAILFDGPNQTGEYANLSEGEMWCCDGPLMPLNDRSQSVYVTPATGSISIISNQINMILDYYIS